MQRGIDEARFRQTNFENKVDGFKTMLDKFDETLKTLTETHKASVEQAIGKTQVIYTELNARINGVANKQNRFELEWDSLKDTIHKLEEEDDKHAVRHDTVLKRLEHLTKDI